MQWFKESQDTGNPNFGRFHQLYLLMTTKTKDTRVTKTDTFSVTNAKVQNSKFVLKSKHFVSQNGEAPKSPCANLSRFLKCPPSPKLVFEQLLWNLAVLLILASSQLGSRNLKNHANWSCYFLTRSRIPHLHPYKSLLPFTAHRIAWQIEIKVSINFISRCLMPYLHETRLRKVNVTAQ